MTRERTQAQIDAEVRREQTSIKTSVRHDIESHAAMKKVMKARAMTGPEALRFAIIKAANELKGSK